MSTFTVKFHTGEALTLPGEVVDVDSDPGVVSLRSGRDTYNFLRESILYWMISNELSDRQLQIVHMMASGKTNGAIARELAFSESTVRHETMAIYRALGVSGRDAAVSRSLEWGLLDIGDSPPASTPAEAFGLTT